MIASAMPRHDLLLLVALAACSRSPSPSTLGSEVLVTHTSLRMRSPQLLDPLPSSVARSMQPQLELELELDRLPLGAAFALTCEWRGPQAELRHENSWQTKPISHNPWPTHCRHSFASDDPLGPWTVVMKAGRRALGSAKFKLE